MPAANGCLGSARGSRAGERVLAIANFLRRFIAVARKQKGWRG